jgi:hypothetical protein
MSNVLESEHVAVAGGLQPGCAIDEENRVADEMFLTEFRKEHLGERPSSRWKQADVKQTVRGGIDSSIQPVSLVVELDHGFVDRNVIRVSAIKWL